MTGEVVQSEGFSREFSLPRKRITRPLVQTWGLLFLNLPLPVMVLEILFSLRVEGNLMNFG